MRLFNDLLIKLFSTKVGNDEFSNQYFQNKSGKRFVVYNGIAEPSKVPFEWFGWLHYTTNIIPININTKKYSWQKIHLPNLTGTKNAYSPKNSTVKNTSCEYESWQPK